ncbi:MAG TPA: response regulator transcription factor [Brumimicrobium sp.]|nr:response regulator transcription factor [Brumimicrobium sp.]
MNTNKEHIKIAILDDEILFRNSFQSLLMMERDFQLVFSGNNGSEFLEYLKDKENIHPDIVLIDIRMPVLNGMDTNKILTKDYPAIKCIALTIFDSMIFKKQMLHHGVVGYITKNAMPDEVFNTIRQVNEKGFSFDSEMIQLIVQMKITGKEHQKANPYLLSEREKEVLKLIGKQYTNKEIANQLFISERTVEGHRNNMITKTASKNIIGLILWGINHQVVDLEIR